MDLSAERQIEAFRAGLNRAFAAYRSGDYDRATLLLYDLCKDLNHIRSLILNERWALRREKIADALARERAPAKADEAD